MTLRLLLAAAGLVLVLAGPAWAVPFCTDNRAGVTVEFGTSFGGGPWFGRSSGESARNDFDLMQLQQLGINATRVERWNGCIRAFVRRPGGGEVMEFYDPNTLQQVY